MTAIDCIHYALAAIIATGAFSIAMFTGIVAHVYFVGMRDAKRKLPQ